MWISLALWFPPIVEASKLLTRCCWFFRMLTPMCLTKCPALRQRGLCENIGQKKPTPVGQVERSIMRTAKHGELRYFREWMSIGQRGFNGETWPD